jgi:hypothetical protein
VGGVETKFSFRLSFSFSLACAEKQVLNVVKMLNIISGNKILKQKTLINFEC